MPTLIHRNPSLRHHRPSGQAVVTLAGKDHYCGPWKSEAARIEYDRLIAMWIANGRRALVADAASELTVAELIEAFWEHAQVHYRHPDRTPTTEAGIYKLPLKILNQLFGDTLVAEFGPLKLEAVRNEMVRKGWVRKSINLHVRRLRHVFKWGCSRQLVSATIHTALTTLAPLKMGRCDAKDNPPVKPVDDKMVTAILPYASAAVATMVQLQLLTAMRPAEVVSMTTETIDRTGGIWVYRPTHFKTAHHDGATREIYLGKRAQELLKGFLKPLNPTVPIFSPREAEAARREAQHEARKTPANHGNTIGTNRQENPRKVPGNAYSTSSYRRAISYAAAIAFPPPPELARAKKETLREWKARLTPDQRKALAAWRKKHSWGPHRLRHSAATLVRREFGIEAASHVLGHRSVNITELYAEKNAQVAARVASAIG